MDLDLVKKIELAHYWHQSNKPDRPIQTSNRWTFILLGRTEESFLNVLKGSFQDEEGTMETLKGYILFDRDVTGNTVLSSLATKNVEKLVGPFIGLCYFSELDTTYTQCLGNEKLHQEIT